MKLLGKSSLFALATSSALLVANTVSNAQTVIFYENWETDHSLDNTYVTNFSSAGAHLADLFFDYGTAGIPLSPNSTNSSMRALKMAANLDQALRPSSNIPSGVSVSPVAFSITENFELRFDAWLNYNGPAPDGGNGSTQVGGAGYGTAGTAAQIAGVADSVYIGGTGDANSSADYRVYAPARPTSYQDGAFRIAGDPNSGFVYAAENGTRNVTPGATTGYYATNFPGQSAPAAQTVLYPQQTGTAHNGALAFKWRDVSLRKTGNTITYSIDGVLIATVDVTDAGTLGGANILFNHYDINNTVSSDPNRTNLTFTLIDNVRVTEYTNIVSVSATAAEATEGGSVGVFTVTRTAAGAPLTVDYTLTGGATNGADYNDALGGPLSGSITFAAADSSTNITIVPVDDAVAEVTENVTFNITPSPNYVGAGSATITISDNETPQLTIASVSSQMFERTNDFARFRVTRLGNTNTTFGVNLSSTGAAVYGTDFYTNDAVVFDLGVQSLNVSIFPIADGSYEGNETATINIAAAGAGEYSIGANSSASVTIVDADGPPETVLFSDNFDTDSSLSWNLFFAATNSAAQDYSAFFAFDYSGQGIPPAPHGNGSTLGLFLTVNKEIGSPAAAAVNLYPIGQNFSGNFALKFDMFLNMISGVSSTEYALFGINHSGTKTNWWRSGGVPAGWTFDGIFYAVETDGGATPHYVNYSSPTTAGNNPTALTSGLNAAAFTSAFKSPPWAVAGSPAMNASSNTPVWAEVELSKIGSIVTLRINNTTILSYSNATSYSSGNLMIGYEDAFDSIGPVQNYVVYDNVRIVRLSAPAVLTITAIAGIGANIQIDFTSSVNDPSSAFFVQSSSNVVGTYNDDGTAVITELSPGVYRATVPKSGDARFYRIRHN